MSAADTILSQISIADLAAQLGVDDATAEAAVREAVPALLLGLDANAQGGGAESLTQAVGQHEGALLDGPVALASIDTADGEKIVQHVFGSNTGQVAQTLGATSTVASSGGSQLVGKLLPMLAPLVMAYLAKQMTGRGGDAGGKGSGGGGVLVDILAGALGGGGKKSGSGGMVADILGGLLGGGRR